MKYIGNKTRLIDFIESSLKDFSVPYKEVSVIDLFAGTGSVSNFFLQNRCQVTSCDQMTYSISELYRTNYFQVEPTFEEVVGDVGSSSLDSVLNYLNGLEPIKGYFFLNYAPSGKYKRQYFTDLNAMKLDAIREKLFSWEEILPYSKKMFLLGILMCAADRVSNTSGTYGAYLKIWRSMALKELFLEKPLFLSKGENKILQADVLDCVKNHKKVEIVYLDPPYNERQYASNFHVLESIVVFDKQELKGVTGLRDYHDQKSNFCMKSKVFKEFSALIEAIDSNYIVMSYSTEGLLKEEEILLGLRQKGMTKVYRKPYRRFKTNAWTEETLLEELLFICKVKEN